MRTAEAEGPGAGKFGFSTSYYSLGSQSAEHQPILMTLEINPDTYVAMSLNLRNIEKKNITKQGKVWVTTGTRRVSSFL